jgi:hypothetical protein
MPEEKLRLHITPFSESLAQFILLSHSSLSPDSISYHTLETFPENSYGYIELAPMEAERLKKKLNGSILKGKKLRIEQARPQKRSLDPELDSKDSPSSSKRGTRGSKRAGNSEPELQGHELISERKVKRGWTEPGKEKRPKSSDYRPSPSVASKYTDKPECLFRVKVPPNKENSGSGKSAKEQDRNSKKRKGTIVHEFQNSAIQPSFIRKETGVGDVGVAAEYADGMGWVDKNGNVIEEASKRHLRSTNRTGEPQRPPTLPKSTASPVAQASTMDEPESSSESGEDRDQPEDSPIRTSANEDSSAKMQASTEIRPGRASSSGTSSSDTQSESEEESEEELQLQPEPKASAADKSDKVKNAPEATSIASTAVHPLEALFKRPNQAASQSNSRRPLEIKTTFSFFEPDDEQTIPQTPFTTRDLQLRGLRSAAPTPDTALPTRRFFAESSSPCSNTDIEDGPDSERPSDDMKQSQEPKKDGESEFATWFWKNRGENNRAWKRRRREAMKEKRQSENRQRDRKIG